VDAGWTSAELELRRWTGTASFCKTNDGGVDDCDVSEGPVCEVELRRGSLHGPRSTSLTISLRFPLSFSPLFCPCFLAHVVSSLAYPNLLGTKRLGCCCCCELLTATCKFYLELLH
jgi:hypothetical protein